MTFQEFLESEGALEAFKANLTEFIGQTIEEHCGVVQNVDYISTAFPWDETPEGDQYWSELSKKWEDMQ